MHALDGVTISVERGEVVGLVGESGCGKSTFGRIVAGIMEPTEGAVFYRGRELRTLQGREAREAALQVQMIFQDPFASLNPRMRVEDIVGEAPLLHGIVSKGERSDYIDATMRRVGLDPAFKRRYPHQFSGGQRQRIGIARALAVNPEFLVCDEAVAALDVSIQAQVLNLFMDLQAGPGPHLPVHQPRSERGGAYLGPCGHHVSRPRGRDRRSTGPLFDGPNHPYTKALACRRAQRSTRSRRIYEPVRGEIPSPLDPPTGCHFHPRCPHAVKRCREEAPALREIAPGRHSACHLNDG